MNILLITSSPRGEASISTRLARDLAQRLLKAHLGATLAERDLNQNPVPFITSSFVTAGFTPADQRSDADRQALSISDALVAEVQRADQIIIGSGMINFGIPANLKAWIDQITRAGLTFAYGAHGPQGLLTGKKTYLALASGGVYSEGPAAGGDFQRPYLIRMLGFLGLTDVEVVLAEGTMQGPDAGEKALAGALAWAEHLLPALNSLATEQRSAALSG